MLLQPWRVKYRRAESPDDVKTVTLSTPNAELSVTEDGLYELLEVYAENSTLYLSISTDNIA